MLKGDKLTGAIVYYDGELNTSTFRLYVIYSLNVPFIFLYYSIEIFITGQQDDARMNLAVALTASRHGATVVNHVSVVNLTKGLDRVSVIL